MSYLPTRPTLFRYSALTFNAHRIHLDPEYCREEEGHPDCLVHGPLTATLLMDLLVKRGIPSTLSGNNSEAGGVPGIKHFEYRATAPLVVCRTISLNGRWEGERTGDGERKATLWATDENGRVGMKAEAVVFGL